MPDPTSTSAFTEVTTAETTPEVAAVAPQQSTATKPPGRDEVIAALVDVFDKGERILNRRQAAEIVKQTITALWLNR